MNLMDIFSDPNQIGTLSFGQKMSASFITMVMGLGITFLVLILIWVFITLMGKCLAAADKKAGAPKGEAALPVTATVPAANSEEEIAAAIAAAIAASEGNPGSRLMVKRIVRKTGPTTPWLNAETESRIRIKPIRQIRSITERK